jgi:trigger factor
LERAAETGDVLLIDVVGEHDGQPIEDLSAQAMSYEIGEDGVLPGLDEAVLGKSAGEDADFVFTPEFGEYEAKPLDVKVSVKAVREKVLPPLDDDLAMLASEFDTLDELRGDLRTKLERSLLADRGGAARTKLQEDLMTVFDIPLPEGIIQSEVDSHFEEHEETDPDHRAEVESNARDALKMQFLMDGIADAEDLAVGEAELSQWLVMQAPRYGMAPDQLAQALVEAGQVPMAVAEVRRSKALAVILESAEIMDTNGEVIDISQLNPDRAEMVGDEAEEIAVDESDDSDESDEV